MLYGDVFSSKHKKFCIQIIKVGLNDLKSVKYPSETTHTSYNSKWRLLFWKEQQMLLLTVIFNSQ
jgi:hypothetical protein